LLPGLGRPFGLDEGFTSTAANPLAAAFESGVTAVLAFSFVGLGSRKNRYEDAETTLSS
jgi:hypothetical protein